MAERNAQNRLNCPTIDFFHEAKTREPHDLLKLSALLTTLGEAATIHDPAKYKPLKGTILGELRTRRGLRLICFRGSGGEYVCTNGAIKKKDDLLEADLRIAERWKNLYDEAAKSGSLSHEPEHIK